MDIINRAGMKDCKPCQTPVDMKSKLTAEAGPKVTDPTLYRSLAGALQYLTFTRPDISYAVQQVCLFMHDPRESHFCPSSYHQLHSRYKGTGSANFEVSFGEAFSVL